VGHPAEEEEAAEEGEDDDGDEDDAAGADPGEVDGDLVLVVVAAVLLDASAAR